MRMAFPIFGFLRLLIEKEFLHMNKFNPKVDDFISKAEKWQAEFEALREIVLECNLSEELKWKQPCYSFGQSNIAIVGGFKDSCVLSFFKGSLLKDDKQLLEYPGPNSRVAKLFRFTNVQEIHKIKPTIKAYILEAIEIEKTGEKIDLRKNDNLDFPEELLLKFDAFPKFRIAFEQLTPGRQRGYNLHFSAAKSSKSRTNRIEKYMDKILSGKGIHDCTCGRSKRMPSCDGSHKSI